MVNDANLTSGPVYGTRRPLVVALALALGVSVGVAAAVGLPAAHASGRPEGGATWPVTQCGDSGAGSLRAAIAGAASGDTIDLGALTCGTVTLTTGAITVAQHDLTVAGAGAPVLTVAAAPADRVFSHTGTGRFTVSGVTVRDGSVTTTEPGVPAAGGCIQSAGTVVLNAAAIVDCTVTGLDLARGGGVEAHSVELVDSRVEGCTASIDGTLYGNAAGGGIAVIADVYEQGDITLTRSTISGNTASALTGASQGGGVALNYGLGKLSVTDSTLTDNRAIGRPYAPGYGYFSRVQGMGGAIFSSNLSIVRSTFSGNEATSGGAIAHGGFPTSEDDALLINSTVSGNTASSMGGAIWSFFGGLKIRNSTIAHNHAEYGAGGVLPQHPLVSDFYDFPPRLDSSIVAANTSLYGSADIETDLKKLVVIGSANLIGVSSLALPADTLHDDPRLLPLADNGGPTLTHALAADSPALDAGNNLSGLSEDQRGDGFPRVLGPAADIGAYERAAADALFADGFD